MTIEVLVRPIQPTDLAAVVDVLIAGSLQPAAESREHVNDYWLAVEEVRRLHGEVFVAEENGEVVGVCQVIVFRNIGNRGQRVAGGERDHQFRPAVE